MSKINENNNKFRWLYKAGFFIILALPILVIPSFFKIPPYFFPPDWGKTIIFRSILAIMLFLCLSRFLTGRNEFDWSRLQGNRGSSAESGQSFKKNKTIWAMAGLLFIFLLASIFSVDPLFSFWGSPYRGGGLVTFAFYFVFEILAFLFLKKNEWEKAWIFSIFIGILVSLVGIIQYYGLFSKIFLATPSQPPSTLGNPISLAIYLLLLFFPTLAFAVSEPKKYLKIFYIFSLLIFLFTIFITGTRAAYLGIIVGALYFLLFYPQRFKNLKIITALLLVFVILTVFYVNVFPGSPKILQKNRTFQILENQLSIKRALNDERYGAWQTTFKEVLDRPILGWGPENLAVGFDKYYNPMLTPSPWWDKAHNIFLDTGAEAGLLGILAYIFLFIILFLQLQKIKRHPRESAVIGENPQLMAHGVQAALTGYLVANFFSFDSFASYLIFFLLIAYSLHLAAQNSTQNGTQIDTEQKKAWWKTVIIVVSFLVLIIFLWQYNILPLQINAKINEAGNLANQGQCIQAFSLMDKALQKHSFLDSYIRMQYVAFTKTCTAFYPENNSSYLKKDIELLSEAVKIQPLYTRYWIFLGTSSTALASEQTNSNIKNDLLEEAKNYFGKAVQLAPKHQEILAGQAEMEIVAGNYTDAQNYSEKCIALNQNFGDCYWYLALSQIYLKDNSNAQKNIQIAGSKIYYSTNSLDHLKQLLAAYNSVSDYQGLARVYETLVVNYQNVAQYHSSLAFVYAKLGEYDKARQEALKVLQLSPQSKQSVEQFLNTLP